MIRAEQGVQPQRPGLAASLHQFARACPPDGAEHRVAVADTRQVASSHPVAERHGEPDEVLERAGRGLAPAAGADAGQIPPVDRDPAGARAVHAGQQFDQSRLAGTVLAHHRDGGAGLQREADVGQRRGVLAGVGEADVIKADAVGQGGGHGLARIEPQARHVVFQPEQAVGGGRRGGERASAGAGPGYLPLGAPQQADHLNHGAGGGLAVRGAQDQGRDRGAEAGRVQDPPGRFPRRGDVRGAQRLAVDLVAEPFVPGQQPVGHPEGAQLPGRGGRRGQREQVIEQPPPVGQVVIGALLHPRRLPVRHGGRDGEERHHDQGRPDQGEQHGRADELDSRADQAQGLGGRAGQGPAAFAQRVDLGQVVGPLEVLQERGLAGQVADPQAEAAGW